MALGHLALVHDIVMLDDVDHIGPHLDPIPVLLWLFAAGSGLAENMKNKQSFSSGVAGQLLYLKDINFHESLKTHSKPSTMVGGNL